MRRPKGSGCIYRVGKQWRGYKTVARQRVYTTVHPTKKGVQDELDKITTASAGAKFLPTVSEWYRSLLEGRFRRTYEESTWRLHEGMWRLRVATSKLGGIRLDLVRRRDVQAFLEDHRRLYRPWSLRRLGSCVHTVFDQAVQDELIAANPAHGVKYPTIDETMKLRLTPDAANRLHTLTQDARLAAMILVALDTGLRRGELCAMLWADVDAQGRVLTVSGQMVRRGGSIARTAPKGGKTGIVELTDAALAAILAQPSVSEYVFTTASGRPVRPEDVSRDFRKMRNAAGLQGLKLKDLRSNFVSTLLETGADIRTVQELARHASSKTTQEVYARSRRDLKRAAMDRVQERRKEYGEGSK